MILAIVTPHYFPSVRGNSITVQRIESSLQDQGLSVQVFSLDRQDGDAILEAMSKGVPVLASDIEGNRTVILDGHDGFLFRSEMDFVEKMERLLIDPALRYAFGRRAMQKIETHFSLDGEIGGHLTLYQSLTVRKGV
jgi:glycosyltransferase involved in cell wall biosynthesis